MPNNSIIVEWFVSLGISDLLTTDDILSGNTLHTVLKKTVNGYKNDFATPASAVNKISNWNNLIKSLEKINIKVSPEEKNQVFHGNEKVVYDILFQVKNYVDQNTKQAEVDINKIDHRSDPKQSKSLLELFILVIIKNLGLNAKESVALLSNDSKYLAHILAKGFKDQANPVLNLLKDFQGLLPKVREFCVNKENEVFFLKSIKPGLISKFKQISELSLQILQQFSLQTQNSFEILKLHLIPTLVLQYRRHPVFLNAISQTILKLSKYSKSLLTIMTNNMNQKELLTFCHQIIQISEDSYQLKHFYSLLKIEQIVTMSIDGLSDSNVFQIALLLVIKIIETNADLITNQPKNLQSILNNLQHLPINKTQHLASFINGIFTLLSIFGRKKNPVAPQFFKLCIQKYKLTINHDESISYGHNFLNIIDEFPSIPRQMIVDAIAQRYDNYKEVVTEIDILLLTKIAFGESKSNEDQDSDVNNLKIPDQKTALKIYNVLSKIFFEDVSNAIHIADTIVFLVVSHPNSKLISQLTLKMVKVALAVHYANIRKLNMSKSIVQGVVKLDTTNAFAKRKNLDVQYFLRQLLNLKNDNFNKTVEPLICYSYIQADSKNKVEAEELGKILSILGNLNVLVRKYEEEVRILHEQKRQKKKPTSTENTQEENKLNSASTDLLKKSKIPAGENYSMYLSRIEKITPDAQKGLQMYRKGFEDKLKKIQLQQLKAIQEEQKSTLLQKKHTLKVLQKGIKVDAKSDSLAQYIYEFNVKQNELLKDICYDLTSLHIFNPNEEEQNDIIGLKYLLKKYNKVLKVFYSNYGGKLRPNSISLFEELAQKQSLMQVATVWKLFKDYELDEFISIREAQYLIQKINTQKKKPYYDTSLLDFEAFEDFIVQASLTMFTRAPKNLSGHSISEIVEETFYQFKMLAGQNKVDLRLFDDETSIAEQDQNVASLNSQLKSNPDYILPQGYKKVVEKKVQYFHNISLDAFNSSYTDVLNILDEIVFDKIGFHILEPFSEVTTSTYAKSLLSKKKEQNNESFKEKYFTLNVKKELFKLSGQDRQIARDVAFSLSEIVDAVADGRKSITKFKYTFQQMQAERKKAQQQIQLKREKRDQQLKKILEKSKQERQQKEQALLQEKSKQQQRIEEEKKKKEKYDQQLKQKVQEYQIKKQDQKKKQQESKLQQKKKQQELFEKKRQQLSKAAKQIQEKKQAEKKAAQEKQRKQKQLLMQKSKKNLKIRSSPKPLKKNIEEIKNSQGEKIKEKENKNIQPSPKQQKP